MTTFYQRVRQEFPEEWNMMVIGQREATKIINKLCRHFKLPKVNVKFNKRVPNCGHYLSWCYRNPEGCPDYGCTIVLHRYFFSIGLIAEEVAHHMDYIKNGDHKHRKTHTKRLITKIKRILKYCAKKNYWGWIKQDKKVNVIIYGERGLGMSYKAIQQVSIVGKPDMIDGDKIIDFKTGKGSKERESG